MYPRDVFLNEDSRAIQKMLREFTSKEIIPVRRQLDEESDFKTAQQIFKKLKDIGVQSYFVLEKYGGSGYHSAIDVEILCEELARGDGGIAISQGITSAAPWPILSAAQNHTLLDILGPQWCGEEVMSFSTVFTEPEGGCDVELSDMEGSTLKTTARLEGDDYVIDGQKNWPTNAGREPGWMLVVCTTEPGAGRDGIAIIFVPVPSEGLSFGKAENKMGYRSCLNRTVYFDKVRVPKEYRLTGPGRDADFYYGEALVPARFTTAAQAVGIAQAAFELVLEYTGERSGGGKRVREHSMIKNIISEMAIGIETARSAAMNVAWQLDHPDVYGPSWSHSVISSVAMARIYANRVAEMVTSKGIELMGAVGVSRDYDMEKLYRDAKITSVWLGGVQTNRYEIVNAYYES